MLLFTHMTPSPLKIPALFFMRLQLQRLWQLLVIVAMVPGPLQAAGADTFTEQVQPYIRKYCVECHNAEETKGELDLTLFLTPADVIGNFRRWNTIVEFIEAGEMPPRESPQPTLEESNALSQAVHQILAAEAKKQAGDPGVVLPRRLSNTEYDLSVRDLTGVDIRPTKDFPADPAGGEGFDNTGESLGMSPNLLKKYLAAAQLVADHLVLRPTGISFAPYPVMSYNERRKLTEGALIRFYEEHTVRMRDYLEAAWRYRYRSPDQQGLSPEAFAVLHQLSGRYLSSVVNFFLELSSIPGAPAEMLASWEAVGQPPADGSLPESFMRFCDLVEEYRRQLTADEGELIRANAGNWPIGHLDFRARTAAARDKFDRSKFRASTLLRTGNVAAAPDDKTSESLKVSVRFESAFASESGLVLLKRPIFSRADNLPGNADEEVKQEVLTLRSVLEESNPAVASALNFGRHPDGSELDPDSLVIRTPMVLEFLISNEMRQRLNGRRLLIPVELEASSVNVGSVRVAQWMGPEAAAPAPGAAVILMSPDGERVRQLETFGSRFCSVFPNRFFYVDSGRGLAAGFHLVEGFFRDDQPLVTGVLTAEQNAELNRLWRELNFVTQSSETLLRGFVWFERSEREVLQDSRFDFLNADDPELIHDALLSRFEKVYMDKLGVRRSGDTLEAEVPDERHRMIRQFFSDVRAGLQQQSELTAVAEQEAMAGLRLLAQRAWRRRLTTPEEQTLQALYHQLRAEGQSVEQSVRGVVVGILMSPDFCYLYREPPNGTGAAPLSSPELASRLSYFLWSSLPDERLFQAAAEGRLAAEDELLQQTRRMLNDERVSAFAREFFGQWLRYRDYPVKDPINAQAFPGYDEPLRQAIFEEPTRFAADLIRRDGAVTELLTADRTFVNGRLAAHYGGLQDEQYQAILRERRQSLSNAGDGDITDELLKQEWHPVTGLKQSGRGGLLGMAVILTKNSAGERTSPVKRGFWSVHHLLGQHFPPPPADVPELPKSEKIADQTIRELLAAHVSDTQCALCHRHFDALGLAMEGFDAIGRARTTDSAGRKIDNVATLPNGNEAIGIPGLIDYVGQHRRDDFLRTLCRKFLGYALGRSVILSDQPLLDEMKAALERNEFRFSVLFETVVRSPQFRNQRSREFVTAR